MEDEVGKELGQRVVSEETVIGLKEAPYQIGHLMIVNHSPKQYMGAYRRYRGNDGDLHNTPSGKIGDEALLERFIVCHCCLCGQGRAIGAVKAHENLHKGSIIKEGAILLGKQSRFRNEKGCR